MTDHFTLTIDDASRHRRQLSLAAGQRYAVGRSDRAHLRLEGRDVSWEHAVVDVEDGKLFLENLSAVGTLVNGERLEQRRRLHPNDEIKLGADCTLRVLTNSARAGARRSWLLGVAIIAVAIIGGAVLIAAKPGAGSTTPPPPTRDWPFAYRYFDAWLGEHPLLGRDTPLVRHLLNEAYRAAHSGNPDIAAQVYSDLKLMLLHRDADLNGSRESFANLALVHSGALDIVLCADHQAAELDHEQRAAALLAYIDEQLRWNLRQNEARP